MWTLLLILPILSVPEPELLYCKPGAAIPISVEDSQTIIEASLNTGLAVPLQTMRAPDSGRHLLALVARDQLGNVSAPKWYLLVVDDQPPTTQLTLSNPPFKDENDIWWVRAGTEAHLKAEDPHSGLKQTFLEVDGKATSSDEKSLTMVLPNGGKTTIKAGATDKVGNQSQVIQREIYLDNLPPTGQIQFMGDQQTYNDQFILGPTSRMICHFQDEGSGLGDWVPLLDGKASNLEKWHGPWSPGPHLVEATADDRAGNRMTLKPRAFVVDAKPPVLQWKTTSQRYKNQAGETYFSNPIVVEATATDEVFGNCALEYFHPDQGWQPFNGVLSIQESTLDLRSQDGVGNLLLKTLSWRQDKEPPRMVLRSPTQETILPSSAISLSVGDEISPEISDSGSGLDVATFQIDQGPYKPIPVRFQFRQIDRFTLTIKASDHQGNQAIGKWQITVSDVRKGNKP